MSSLAVNTSMSPHQQLSNIKNEPLSPPRDVSTPSNHLRPPSAGQHRLSPSPHSNCSSPHHQLHSPQLKRARLSNEGGWSS